MKLSRVEFAVLIKNVAIEKFVKLGFILLVVTYQLLPVAHIFLGEIKFLGKNMIIVVPVLFIGMSLLFFSRYISRGWIFYLVFLTLGYCFLACLSIVIYDAKTSVFLDRRYCIVPVLMALLIFKLLVERQYRQVVLGAFILAIISECTWGIIHGTFFHLSCIQHLILDMVDLSTWGSMVMSGQGRLDP